MTHLIQNDADSHQDGSRFSEAEIATMSRVLRRRFGDRAGLTAQILATEHDTIGDFERAAAWRRVAIELASPEGRH